VLTARPGTARDTVLVSRDQASAPGIFGTSNDVRTSDMGGMLRGRTPAGSERDTNVKTLGKVMVFLGVPVAVVGGFFLVTNCDCSR